MWIHGVHIVISFHFNEAPQPSAVTGVEGNITDLILPAVGDVVEHRNASGVPFRGRVTDRIFRYNLPRGDAILQGDISVQLCLDRTTIH